MKTPICKLIPGILAMAAIMPFMTACSDDDKVIYGTCAVSGTVPNSDGDPIEGASVTVLAAEAVCTPAKATTDSDGKYSLTMKEATDPLLFMVEAPGYYDFNEVVEGIPYKDALPDETLGTATITRDFVLRPEAD